LATPQSQSGRNVAAKM